VRVAVLAGGRSSEHEVSLASGAAVRGGLGEAGHEVLEVELARDGTWWSEGAELQLRAGRGLLGADAAFPVLHGPFGEDGTVQGLLELLDVPYVGSGVLASALCLDKVISKEVFARGGLPQVAHEAVTAAAWAADPDGVLARLGGLGVPVFVKPARMGSSVGIARAGAVGELAAALEGAFAHDHLVVVEAASPGLEVECSVLGHAHAATASAPGEIVLAGREDGRWYDFEAKYSAGGMELRVPAAIAARDAARVRALAVEAFARAGCAGLARVDFFVEEGGRVLLNEVNTMPGFTPTSVYAKLWAADGLAYPALCDRLVSLALERFGAERAPAP
jgi:D-alanine-D-alanine ligase